MAPRGRHPKSRTSRMDAAIDAMKPFGFTQDIVMAKMRELLKEYEGEYGFIELDAYRVLLDALIADQEQTELEETSKANEIADGEMVQEDHDTVHHPSGFIDIPVCSSTPLSVIPPPPLSSPQPPPPPPPPPRPPSSPPPPPSSPPPPTPPPPHTIMDTVLLPPPPPLPPSVMYAAAIQPFESDQLERRKPCHGWISDDGKELQFIIIPSSFPGQISPPESPPAQSETPHQQAQPGLTSRSKSRPKRRSRWDLTPEDMQC